MWLGVIWVVKVAGLMQLIARAICPVIVRLFPEVPTVPLEPPGLMGKLLAAHP